MLFSESSLTLSRNRIPVVGIVGGIGSGKSAVASWIAEMANVAVIDADRFGHDVLFSKTIMEKIRTAFGSPVFDDCGEIQRKVLAEQVFGSDHKHRSARRKLEQIVHPEIRRRIALEIDRLIMKRYDAILLDAALLFEADWQDSCDAVVFVDAPTPLRWTRIQQRSDWTAEDLSRRESSQWDLAQKRSRCQCVISNTQEIAAAGEELLRFLGKRWSISCKPC
jgi:dephospho-CoA kinase